MKKITYLKLQQKYPQKIVALDRAEKRVLAAGEKFADIFKKLKAIRINVQNAVFVGPIQKKGAINVYFSLPEKNHR